METALLDKLYKIFDKTDPSHSYTWEYLTLISGFIIFVIGYRCLEKFTTWLWKKCGKPSFETIETIDNNFGTRLLFTFIIFIFSPLIILTWVNIHLIEWGADKHEILIFIRGVFIMLFSFLLLLGVYLVVLISKINKIQNYVEEQKRKEAEESEQL